MMSRVGIPTRSMVIEAMLKLDPSFEWNPIPIGKLSFFGPISLPSSDGIGWSGSKKKTL